MRAAALFMYLLQGDFLSELGLSASYVAFLNTHQTRCTLSVCSSDRSFIVQ